MMTPRSILVCLVLGMATGCTGVSVVKNPDEGDPGIRYWRPKPYLLVTPADATGRMVKIKLEYLPDFSEEYAILPRGKKAPAISLKDGWNLVAVGGPAPPPEPAEADALPAAPTDPTKVPEFVVAATNVPIGYYESVFDKNGTKKTLKGWRYIGLSPIAGGDAIGVDPKALAASKLPPGCPPPPPESSMPGPLYGMVFFNGVMTFRQLDEIANNQTCPQYVKIIPDKPEPPPAPPQTGGIDVQPPREQGGIDVKPDEPEPSGGIDLQEPSLNDEPSLEPTTPPIPQVPSPSGEGASLNLLPAPEDRAVSRSSIKIPPPKSWSDGK